jgi:NAD-reducing hydrogenase large subunit
MSKRIVIDPVTRIEGHAKISIFLDDAGNVSDAEFHVVEFRGFEKFCEGRPYGEMPGITPRICGICPVSHLLASAKAGDAIMAVNIPPAADKLRRLMNLGQIVQSHALSFFHLSAPDFLLGWDTPPRSATSSASSPPTRTSPAPASASASSARKSSKSSAARKSIPLGPCPAACAAR